MRSATPTWPCGCSRVSTAPTATSSASTPGAALLAAGLVDDLTAGMEAALEAIDSGAAVATLAKLVEVSQREAAAEPV